MSGSSTKKQMTRIRGGTCGWLLFFDVSRVGSCWCDSAEDVGGAGAVAVGVAGAVLGRKRSSTLEEACVV